MQYLKNLKIRYKLTLLMTLTSMLSLMLVGGMFIAWGYASARRALADSLSTQAEMIADGSEAALAFDDTEDAASILNTLRLEPSIAYAGVFTSDNRKFAQYFRENVKEDIAPHSVHPDGYYFKNGYLTVFKTIAMNNQTLGSVCLRSDLKPLQTLLRKNTTMVVATLFSAFLLAYVLSVKLQRIISEPILGLADTARQVSENKEFSIRAIKTTEDETGALIEAFNEMLNQIQQRDLQMLEINQNLEHKVQERTAELTREIAERKNIEKGLRRERNFSKGIIETAQVIILILDTNGKIVSFNPFLEQKTGYSLEEVKGKDWFDTFMNDENILETKKIFEQTTAGINTGGKINPIRTKDGQKILVEWYNKTLKDDQGKSTGVLSIGHDVTERKKYEDKLKNAKKQAEAANEAKSAFLANMSHEIRTPMNAIIGFSDLMAEEDNLADAHKEFVNLIRTAGKNLLSIINDILDFSKIEARKLQVECTEFSLEEMLYEFDSIMRPQAAAKNLKYEVIQCGNLPKIIKSDPLRIHQCLTNLVNNAIKFTDQGHVFLHVSADNRDGRDCIIFDVEDTGIGISRQKLESIFQEFNQADNSTTRKYGGTGLGLAIAKRLAELMGGYLNVTSEPDKGSTFSMAIPAGVDISSVDYTNKYAFVDALNNPDSSEQDTLFTGKILAAEDNPSNQILIKKIFEKIGLNLTLVDDGRQALDAVLREPFDIIFLDMQMPVMNGYEAAKAIRKEEIKTPIVALTANAMKDDDQKCFQAGCSDYLSKPLEKARLLEILQKYLPAQVASCVLEKN